MNTNNVCTVWEENRMQVKLEGERLYLRDYEPADAEAFLDLHVRNRTFFERYSITRSDSFYTLQSRLEAIEAGLKQRDNDEGCMFGMFRKSDELFVGSIGLSSIQRGPLQNCNLGYYLDQRHNGLGYATEAVKLITRFAFEELKLHRVEAGVMPVNIASARVLEKAGFLREGTARKNVNINGRWEDHIAYAMLAEDIDAALP